MRDDLNAGPANEIDAEVEVVPYDPSWPARFAAERSRLEIALAPWLVGEIEHIGSTAVAGLPAKPVIDIMAPVASLNAALPALAAATNAGYVHHPYRAEVMHWFCKPSPSHRTHHLHLVPRHSSLWNERLQFRDQLRCNPVLAADYAALKTSLARSFRHDREAYTEGKSAFIRRALTCHGAPGGDAT